MKTTTRPTSLASLLLAALAFTAPLDARNEWLTGLTEGEQTTPLSVTALKSPLPRGAAVRIGPVAALPVAASGPVQIDLTMSIIDNPQGDNDGNQQGQAGSAEQDKWERIVQHFADAVWESTEGAHQIRRVYIFREGRNAKNADIVWTERGHPQVPVGGGVGEPGGHIAMFKTFADGLGKGKGDKDMLADEIGSGYTMAHEWGHYFYGVYDEYRGENNTTDIPVKLSIMNSQWMATAGDYRWLNFSVAHRGGGRGGTPFGDWEDTILNVQHRVHGASAWETIARSPSSDPRTGSLGKRVFYPELAAVAPTGTNLPAVNLPSSAARAKLDIIWADKLLLEVVIDNSGSMAGSPLENAKAAAQLLIDRLEVGRSRVGVIVFSSTASVLTAITDITSDADKTTIKNAISQITDEGSTAIGDAAQLALDQVLAVTNSERNSRAVFLLSDGESNTGVDPLSVIPAYQNAKVPLFTFAYGSGADTATLSSMATQTGGRFYLSPTSLPDITRAFQDAFSATASTPTLDSGSFTTSPTREMRSRFPVESGLETLQLSAVVPSGAVEVELIDPRGQRISPSSILDAGNDTIVNFSIPDPAPGTWSIVARSLDGSVSPVDFQIGATTDPDGLALAAYSLAGPSVAFPQPVLVRAKLDGERPVAGANVTAYAIAPSGRAYPFKLADNGVEPDDLAGDGAYSGYFYYTESGQHEVVVKVDNRRRTARFTSRGSVSSATVDGSVLPPERDRAVGQNFTRTARFSVQTSGGTFASSQQQLPQGTYATLSPAPDLGHEHGAALLLTVSRGGGFSGTLGYGGRSYGVRGAFNRFGGYAGNIARRGQPPLRLSLQLDALNGSKQLSGRLTDGGYTTDLLARLNPFSVRRDPTPAAGYYTGAVFAEPGLDPDAAPVGNGFMAVQVTAGGLVRGAGKLADGTPFTMKSALNAFAELPLYAGLDRGLGSIFGTLFGNDQADAFAGQASWIRGAGSTLRLYPDGFSTMPTIELSRYTPPLQGARVLAALDRMPNVQLVLDAGGLAALRAVDGTLARGNRLTIDGLDTTLRLTPRTGLLSGSFVHPQSAVRTPLLGAVAQGENFGTGFFLGSVQGGVFDLVARGTTASASASGLPLAIPDNDANGIASTVNITSAGTVVEVRVSLGITHTFRGDLQVALRSPGGTTVLLQDQDGGSANDFSLARRFVGGFLGEAAGGTWELTVKDLAGADVGTLDSWSLEVKAD